MKFLRNKYNKAPKANNIKLKIFLIIDPIKTKHISSADTDGQLANNYPLNITGIIINVFCSLLIA